MSDPARANAIDSPPVLDDTPLRGARVFDTDLYKRLLPVVRAQVRIAVRPWSGRIGVDDADDLVNHVFAHLYAREGAALQRWDPARGSLEGYVAIVARTRLQDLQSKEMRRRGLAEFGSLDDDAASRDPGSPETYTAASELGRRIYECVRARIQSETGRILLEHLFVQGAPDEQVMAETGLDRTTIYRWRKTIRDRAEECRSGLTRMEGPEAHERSEIRSDRAVDRDER